MNLTTIHEPPFEPVTLADVYRVLKVDPTGSPATHPLDDDFTRQITTARRNVEQQTRRSLVRQTLRLSMGDFPVPQWAGAWVKRYGRAVLPVSKIELFRPPVISVQSVQYFDADNTLQTVSASDYYLTDDLVPELRFASSFTAPTVYDRPDALRVTYVTGYLGAGSPASTQAEYAEHVPAELKDAILVGVQMLQTSTSPQDYELLQRMQRALIHPLIVQLVL
jgi:uncharacterized phiE125 gp8 family phage protein